MSGNYQAVFARCRDEGALREALEKVVAQETWPARAPRRIDVAEVSFRKSWCLLQPVEPNFFLERNGAGAPRLGRFSRALGAPVYEVDVRDGVATTLFEADTLGRMRVSGSSIYFVTGADDDVEPTGLVHAGDVVSFGLLAVSDAIRQNVARLADSLRLPDYLGELAGFPAWRHGEQASTLLSVERPRRR